MPRFRTSQTINGDMRAQNMDWNQIFKQYYQNPASVNISLKDWYSLPNIKLKNYYKGFNGVAYFGETQGVKRKQSDITSRCALNFDIDGGNFDELAKKAQDWPFATLMHTTFKSTDQQERIRIVVPIKETIRSKNLKDDFELISRSFARDYLADQLNLDPKSFEVQQVMYFPVVPKDGQYKVQSLLNKPHFDAVKFYVQQRDIAKDKEKWFYTKEEVKVREQKARQRAESIARRQKYGQKDYQGENVIKAFNARYTIQDVLTNICPGVYNPTNNDTIWGKADSHSAPGLKIYGDVCVCYHSKKDPELSDGRAHDAFDVFRIHKCHGDMKEAIKIAANDYLNLPRNYGSVSPYREQQPRPVNGPVRGNVYGRPPQMGQDRSVQQSNVDGRPPQPGQSRSNGSVPYQQQNYSSPAQPRSVPQANNNPGLVRAMSVSKPTGPAKDMERNI